jgi:hypothetical protein
MVFLGSLDNIFEVVNFLSIIPNYGRFCENQFFKNYNKIVEFIWVVILDSFFEVFLNINYVAKAWSRSRTIIGAHGPGMAVTEYQTGSP